MVIRVLPFGQLKKLLGKDDLVIELPANSTLKDLIEKIGKDTGVELIEDSKVVLMQKTPVKILIGNRDYKFLGCLDARLYDGTPVYLIPIGVGG